MDYPEKGIYGKETKYILDFNKVEKEDYNERLKKYKRRPAYQHTSLEKLCSFT